MEGVVTKPRDHPGISIEGLIKANETSVEIRTKYLSNRSLHHCQFILLLGPAALILTQLTTQKITVNIVVFPVTTPYTLIGGHLRFEPQYCIHLQAAHETR
jgi:hypothetical protein